MRDGPGIRRKHQVTILHASTIQSVGPAAQLICMPGYPSAVSLHRCHRTVPTLLTGKPALICRWLKQLGGTTFTNYVEWLLMTFAFSLVDVPAISVPCGLTAAGLPVGLQIIGGHREDAAVLHAAALYERSQKWKDMVPLQRLGQ